MRQIHDPQLMMWVQLALMRAWPDRPERCLSIQPVSRLQFSYFEKNCRIAEMREAHLDQKLKGACDTALHIGLFDPSAGTPTAPDKTNTATGDAAWLRTMTDVHTPTERNKSKHDPDAVYFHRSEDRPARGHQFVQTSARSPHRQERVVFASQVKPKGVTEDDLFSEHISRMLDYSPEIAKGLFAAVHDGAMDSETQDRLLDMGVIPHTGTRRTKGHKPGAVSLRPQNSPGPTASKRASKSSRWPVPRSWSAPTAQATTGTCRSSSSGSPASDPRTASASTCTRNC
ncbi:hypothetical protein [Candidatus Poriferisocius sp.]|uniref:hypothetical protein n=1 Tax=Candidatus Poriferisocius sp. TaxID=3101276 RepID=UPI003B02CBA6